MTAIATRRQVVDEARSWLETPYQHQGVMKGVACDCRGLVIGTARALGLVPPGFDVNGYARYPDGKSLIAACDQYMTRITRATMQFGDILVIRWHQDPQHMAILGDYVHGGLSVIHALGSVDGKGEVVEHRLDAAFTARFAAAYRLPGVT